MEVAEKAAEQKEHALALMLPSLNVHTHNVERKYVEAWGFLHKVIQEKQTGIAGSPAPLQHPHNLVRPQYNHLCCYTRNNIFLNVLWDLGNISFMRIMCSPIFGAREVSHRSTPEISERMQ